MRERQRRPDSAQRAEHLLARRAERNGSARAGIVDATWPSERDVWDSIARSRTTLPPETRPTRTWVAPRAAPLSSIPLRRGQIRPSEHDPFFADVIVGLASRPRSIPSRWLWDERGAQLFERLADTPEHFAVRCVRQVIERHGDAIARALDRASVDPRGVGEQSSERGIPMRLIEIGPRDTPTTRVLLDRLRPRGWQSMTMDEWAERPVRSGPPPLPGHKTPVPSSRAALVFFSGGALGSLAPHEGASALSRAALFAGIGGALLVAVEAKVGRDAMESAYDDRLGAAAAFHRNVLVRVNREIGATFDVTRFAHRVVYDPIRERLEASLVCESAQRVWIGGRIVELERDEAILVEHRQTYTAARFAQLAARAGLVPLSAWSEPAGRVTIHALAVPR